MIVSITDYPRCYGRSLNGNPLYLILGPQEVPCYISEWAKTADGSRQVIVSTMHAGEASVALRWARTQPPAQAMLQQFAAAARAALTNYWQNT